jgi:hypothetical protein
MPEWLKVQETTLSPALCEGRSSLQGCQARERRTANKSHPRGRSGTRRARMRAAGALHRRYQRARSRSTFRGGANTSLYPTRRRRTRIPLPARSALLASSVFVKKPERIVALNFVMVVCLLVYRLADHRLRKRLAESGQIIPDQAGKPSAKPTMRWVF